MCHPSEAAVFPVLSTFGFLGHEEVAFRSSLLDHCWYRGEPVGRVWRRIVCEGGF